MNVHGDHVASLSRAVAKLLHQPEAEVRRIELAATLHDIGKTALPESLLNKPGPLNAQEWEFMHRHTAIGERIILAAPALANTAPLVRSSHADQATATPTASPGQTYRSARASSPRVMPSTR